MRLLVPALGLCLAASFPTVAAAQSVPEQAVTARLAGDPAAAVALLEPWLADHPGDVDARVQLGYALLALGRLDRAEAQFRAVLAAAPDYTDAREGLDLIELRRRAPDAEARPTLLLEGSIADVEGSLQDWHEAGATLTLPLGPDNRLETRAAWYDRFGRKDTEGTVQLTHRPDADTWVRIGAGATPHADFRPEVSLSAGVDRRLSQGPQATVIGLDAAWRQFPAQDVWTVSPMLTRYGGDEGQFSVTLRGNALVAQGDRLRFGGSLRGDYAPAERTRAFLGVAAGPDTDLGVVTDTWSLFGGGEIPLGERFSLTASAAREWREGPGDRTEVRIGVKLGL